MQHRPMLLVNVSLSWEAPELMNISERLRALFSS
jgi:hypothetical protein